MATDVTKELSDHFYVPPELKNVTRKKPANETIVPNLEQGQSADFAFDDAFSSDEEGFEDELEVPGSIEIISQTVRTAPDGRQVVDVIIDVEDVSGVLKYDIRITVVE